MKANKFKDMKPEELQKTIADLKSELFNLRFKLATGQLENTMEISKVKRDIARALTLQSQSKTR